MMKLNINWKCCYFTQQTLFEYIWIFIKLKANLLRSEFFTGVNQQLSLSDRILTTTTPIMPHCLTTTTTETPPGGRKLPVVPLNSHFTRFISSSPSPSLSLKVESRGHRRVTEQKSLRFGPADGWWWRTRRPLPVRSRRGSASVRESLLWRLNCLFLSTRLSWDGYVSCFLFPVRTEPRRSRPAAPRVTTSCLDQLINMNKLNTDAEH